MLLTGIRRRHDFAAADAGIRAQWREFLAEGGEPAGKVGPNRYGVMCGADATGMEYMCGVEVESFAGLPEGVGRMRVPAQRYAVFAHPGPTATLRSTWGRILAWLEAGPYRSAETPDFEVYATGVDPLSGAGVEVWVGVVEREAR